MTPFRFVIAAALLWPMAALAYDPGPATGSKVPPLHATDASGKTVDLKAISGKKGVVLIFFRSAKWCPFCQKQLIEFRAAQAPLEEKGYRLAAISYDTPEILTEFAAKQKIGYELLSDRGSVTIDSFNLRDQQYGPDSFAYGVPHPSIFVIATDGTVQAKLAEEGFKERPTVEAVLAAVSGIGS